VTVCCQRKMMSLKMSMQACCLSDFSAVREGQAAMHVILARADPIIERSWLQPQRAIVTTGTVIDFASLHLYLPDSSAFDRKFQPRARLFNFFNLTQAQPVTMSTDLWYVRLLM